MLLPALGPARLLYQWLRESPLPRFACGAFLLRAKCLSCIVQQRLAAVGVHACGGQLAGSGESQHNFIPARLCVLAQLLHTLRHVLTVHGWWHLPRFAYGSSRGGAMTLILALRFPMQVRPLYLPCNFPAPVSCTPALPCPGSCTPALPASVPSDEAVFMTVSQCRGKHFSAGD